MAHGNLCLRPEKELYFNDEPIEIQFQPAAVTDGDSLVVFRHSDVIATGDIFQNHPLSFHRRR